MSKSLQLTKRQWERLQSKLKEDYPPSVILIRRKMKETLGFVHRVHRDFEEVPAKHGVKMRTRHAQMLDFYSEKKYTWFLMKYSDFINGDD